MSGERHGRAVEWVRGRLYGIAFMGLFLLFIAFYLLCGLAAALAQVWANPASEVPMVGASGAISVNSSRP